MSSCEHSDSPKEIGPEASEVERRKLGCAALPPDVTGQRASDARFAEEHRSFGDGPEDADSLDEGVDDLDVTEETADATPAADEASDDTQEATDRTDASPDASEGTDEAKDRPRNSLNSMKRISNQ